VIPGDRVRFVEAIRSLRAVPEEGRRRALRGVVDSDPSLASLMIEVFGVDHLSDDLDLDDARLDSLLQGADTPPGTAEPDSRPIPTISILEEGCDSSMFAGDSDTPGSSWEIVRRGLRMGAYALLSRLGSGTFGEVWLAERRVPYMQRVAVKIFREKYADRPDIIARFEQERQALAALDHPHIARLIDGGVTEGGRPYFVMEYVRGETLDDYCDTRKLGIERRLELFLQVCDAVDHAHSKSIVHRDLKPENILVFDDEHDQPVVKVIDFGIAKTLSVPMSDRMMHTGMGGWIGTPAYMSPEQAKTSTRDIDHRSDVYGLGVVLYELLTGCLPFDFSGKSDEEIRRIILEDDPQPPSARVSHTVTADRMVASRIATSRKSRPDTLVSNLRRELEWIPMRAMRKERTERYRHVSELADDVRNYLEARPLMAGPPTVVYRMRKYARRHRAFVASSLAIAVVVVIGGAALVFLAIENAEARGRNDSLARMLELRRDQNESLRRYFGPMLADDLEVHDAERLRSGRVTPEHLQSLLSAESMYTSLCEESGGFLRSLEAGPERDRAARLAVEDLAVLSRIRWQIAGLFDSPGWRGTSLPEYDDGIDWRRRAEIAVGEAREIGAAVPELEIVEGLILRDRGDQLFALRSRRAANGVASNEESWDEVVGRYEEALSRFDTVVDDASAAEVERRTAERHRVTILTRLADCEERRGATPQGTKVVERRREIVDAYRRILASAEGESFEGRARRDLAVAIRRLAFRSGEVTEQLKLHHEALRTVAPLLELDSIDAETRWNIANSNLLLADLVARGEGEAGVVPLVREALRHALILSWTSPQERRSDELIVRIQRRWLSPTRADSHLPGEDLHEMLALIRSIRIEPMLRLRDMHGVSGSDDSPLSVATSDHRRLRPGAIEPESMELQIRLGNGWREAGARAEHSPDEAIELIVPVLRTATRVVDWTPSADVPLHLHAEALACLLWTIDRRDLHEPLVARVQLGVDDADDLQGTLTRYAESAKRRVDDRRSEFKAEHAWLSYDIAVLVQRVAEADQGSSANRTISLRNR
jgi:serine/threonine protein kinase